MAVSAIYFLKLFFLSRKQVRKSVDLLWNSQNVWPKTSKLFIAPHHNIYDQAENLAFHQKRDSLQYNASLAITGPIRGTSKEKLWCFDALLGFTRANL